MQSGGRTGLNRGSVVGRSRGVTSRGRAAAHTAAAANGRQRMRACFITRRVSGSAEGWRAGRGSGAHRTGGASGSLCWAKTQGRHGYGARRLEYRRGKSCWSIREILGKGRRCRHGAGWCQGQPGGRAHGGAAVMGGPCRLSAHAAASHSGAGESGYGGDEWRGGDQWRGRGGGAMCAANRWTRVVGKTSGRGHA